MSYLRNTTRQLGALHGFSGMSKIKGVVSVKDIPIQCLVKIHEKISGILVCQGKSDQNGHYEFSGLSSQFTYYAVAHHPKSQYNAVIQDNVVPK